MRLGAQDIALVRFATQGRPYPRDSRSDDLWFQHLAIVVNDMDLAYAHLSSHAGWRPISEGGPQLLPPSNGAVRAFKFRDPDGHPLELIWFPPGQGRACLAHENSAAPFLGIDHSALSVASTSRSLAFYRALGLRVSERSVNRGPAQERLDGVPSARVRVTSLRPVSASSPGLELLGYRPSGRAAGMVFPNDLVTDWVTLAVRPSSGDSSFAIQDPDGHRLVLVRSGRRRDRAAGMRPDHMGGGEWVLHDLADRQTFVAPARRGRDRLRKRSSSGTPRNARSPSPSLKRQKSGKRQNW